MQQAFTFDMPKRKSAPSLLDYAFKNGCVTCGKRPDHLWMPEKGSYPRFTCPEHRERV